MQDKRNCHGTVGNISGVLVSAHVLHYNLATRMCKILHTCVTSYTHGTCLLPLHV